MFPCIIRALKRKLSAHVCHLFDVVWMFQLFGRNEYHNANTDSVPALPLLPYYDSCLCPVLL